MMDCEVSTASPGRVHFGPENPRPFKKMRIHLDRSSSFNARKEEQKARDYLSRLFLLVEQSQQAPHHFRTVEVPPHYEEAVAAIFQRYPKLSREPIRGVLPLWHLVRLSKSPIIFTHNKRMVLHAIQTVFRLNPGAYSPRIDECLGMQGAWNAFVDAVLSK